MLYFMRKHAKYFYVLFFLIIVSFVFMYVGPIDQNTVPVLVEIGEDSISLDEYWRSYDRLRNFYRDVYKDEYDKKMEEKLNIKQKALDALLEERLLIKKASSLGLKVSDSELQDTIVREEAFKRDGIFRKDVYLRVLELNRLSPVVFEEQKRKELLVRKIRALIEEAVTLTDEEIKEIKGEEQLLETVRNAVLAKKRELIVRSYIETLKKEFDVKIHSELI